MKVVLIEDSVRHANAIIKLLTEEGFQTHWVQGRTPEAMAEEVRVFGPDVVLLDHEILTREGTFFGGEVAVLLTEYPLLGIGSQGNPGNYFREIFLKHPAVVLEELKKL